MIWPLWKNGFDRDGSKCMQNNILVGRRTVFVRERYLPSKEPCVKGTTGFIWRAQLLQTKCFRMALVRDIAHVTADIPHANARNGAQKNVLVASKRLFYLKKRRLKLYILHTGRYHRQMQDRSKVSVQFLNITAEDDSLQLYRHNLAVYAHHGFMGLNSPQNTPSHKNHAGV